MYFFLRFDYNITFRITVVCFLSAVCFSYPVQFILALLKVLYIYNVLLLLLFVYKTFFYLSHFIQKFLRPLHYQPLPRKFHFIRIRVSKGFEMLNCWITSSQLLKITASLWTINRRQEMRRRDTNTDLQADKKKTEKCRKFHRRRVWRKTSCFVLNHLFPCCILCHEINIIVCNRLFSLTLELWMYIRLYRS